MDKRFCILVILVSLMLVLVSCGSGDGGGGDTNRVNIFTITGITTDLKEYSYNACIVGMYPVGTTVDQAISDTKRYYGLEVGPLRYAVAGREVYHSAATGPEGNWTESDTLKSAESGFTEDWRGHGTYTAYWLLQDTSGTYRVYKMKSPRTISEGEHLSVHAVDDFQLVRRIEDGD
jgi:hypothetical protein